MASDSNDVQVILAGICDNVRDEIRGKKSFMGLFTTFHVSDYQQPLPNFAIFIRFGFKTEGPHQIDLEIRSRQGDFSMGIQGQVRVANEKDHAYDRYIADLIVNLNNLKIPREGQYIVNIKGGDTELTHIPFFVKTAPPPQRQ